MTGSGLTVRAADAEQTQALAAAVASLLRPGDVVALSGELGAGKTCFVQGAAAALGVTGRVTSPTFTIMRSYRGRVPVVHIDVYRLDRLQDVLELGEDAVGAADAVTFVEWGDTVASVLPVDRLDVAIETALDDDGRTVVLVPRGAWLARADDLERVLAAWRPEGARPAAR